MARKKIVSPPEVPTSKLSTQKRFVLVRKVDSSSVSGVGVVAEGTQFSNGEVCLHWLSALSSIGIYSCIDSLLKIHGHGSNTELCWIDIDEVERPND